MRIIESGLNYPQIVIIFIYLLLFRLIHNSRLIRDENNLDVQPDIIASAYLLSFSPGFSLGVSIFLLEIQRLLRWSCIIYETTFLTQSQNIILKVTSHWRTSNAKCNREFRPTSTTTPVQVCITIVVLHWACSALTACWVIDQQILIVWMCVVNCGCFSIQITSLWNNEIAYNHVLQWLLWHTWYW